MKNLLFTLFLLFSMTTMAQKDVTKFLRIPVDGTKNAMIQKLKEKGFKYNQTLDQLTGEFNGSKVNLSIVTNNNKVYRIAVQDATPSSETDIKIRFNTLCYQFAKNEKYTSANSTGYTLSESENISYEMTVNKKRYEAVYFQVPDPALMDTLAIQQKAKAILLKSFTQEQLDNPTEQQKEQIQKLLQDEGTRIFVDLLAKKSVWFMIDEKYGNYRILLFYDNEYNHADGEDL